jgi:hypothetical protein
MPECNISCGGREIREASGCCCRSRRHAWRSFLKGAKECRDENLASVLLRSSGASLFLGAARCAPSRDRTKRPIDHQEGGKERI